MVGTVTVVCVAGECGRGHVIERASTAEGKYEGTAVRNKERYTVSLCSIPGYISFLNTVF